MLVGSFPESSIVRRWTWPRYHDPRIDVGGVSTPGPRKWLTIGTELIASRTDLVLADLSGRWHELYHEGPEELVSIAAVPDEGTPFPADVTTPWEFEASPTSPTFELTCSVYEVVRTSYRDFFFIQDDDHAILEQSPDRLRLRVQPLPPGLVRRPFGDVVRSYFETQAADAGTAGLPARAKKAYPWSVLGDWTLRLDR